MKISKKSLHIMADYMGRCLDHLKIDKKEKWLRGVMDQLWFKTWLNVNYNDDNPNVIFIDGKRLFKQDSSLQLYPDDCNDEHMKTAFKYILKMWDNA